METIILKQYSPVVIPKRVEKKEQNEILNTESKSSGFKWVIASVVVLAVVLYVIISSIKRDRNAELVNA